MDLFHWDSRRLLEHFHPIMTHCHNNYLIGLFVPDADAISGLREAAADGHLQDADHHDEGGRLLQVLPSFPVATCAPTSLEKRFGRNYE